MTVKQEGRPRDPAISQALVWTAERWLETVGFDKLTVDGIVAEIGTTRQTFYRRYKNLAMLSLEIVVDRYSSQEEVDSGNLQTDLLQFQRSELAFLTTPLIQKSLSGLLQAIRADPEASRLYFDGMILPRQQKMTRILARATERGEIERSDIDPVYICDLMFGPLIARVLTPATPPLDDRLARQLVSTALRELQ
ncbi:TetR/AcrR family transcriptional regulator [Leucobacter insecticola]|uniref:TetR/AcrR family transcriptional regulator n=1 Tax=Leucobacter insecticola TaxID=2714934 RepID=A0A6G8FKZ0_9MICO|nr:TetR/AcrR family transcriptional regulator [Leucobacter insecticola]QIM17150.1 TetR/AcrR family transcriptional regulator [Leucobacter insecticola]